MIQSNPLHSLSKGSWFKLICGASYQHLTTVRSLAVAYSLAGADCIDVAAESCGNCCGEIGYGSGTENC